MKTILSTLFAASLTIGAYAQMPEMKYVATAAQLKLETVQPKMQLTVTNPNSSFYHDAPVCVALPKDCAYKSATVRNASRKEIPSQMDDLDGDGIMDELSFVADLSAGAKEKYTVTFSTRQAAPDRYPARVHAQMYIKDKDKKRSYLEKQHIAVDTISEVVDNMYSVMYHHGPAMENEYFAFRVYFDSKQSPDLYGKHRRQLELQKGMWYSHEIPDTARKYQLGDDIIKVLKTVSVGALRGWDESLDDPSYVNNAPGTQDPCLLMYDPFKWRQARIVTKGPVRTIVDMNLQGWQYKGHTLNLKSRYVLYAGNRECQIIQQIDPADGKSVKDLEFVTGVLKVGAFNTDSVELAILKYTFDDKGFCASYGKDWPDGNHVKYPTMQAVGLAVSIPQQYLTRTIDRKEQVMYGVKPAADNSIIYRMSFCAGDMETFAPHGWDKWNPFRWFGWGKMWAEQRPVIVEL